MTLIANARSWCKTIRTRPAALSEAIPMVQKLCDELEKLQWIDVKERLPEPYVSVLIKGFSTDGSKLGTHLGSIRGPFEDEWHFDTSFPDGSNCDPNLNDNVTHWMPRPE